VEVDDRWTELDYGDFEGRPFSDVPSETWRRWRQDASYRPPGGESLAALGRRVREACEHLAHDGGNGDVAVVSHVSPTSPHEGLGPRTTGVSCPGARGASSPTSPP